MTNLEQEATITIQAQFKTSYANMQRKLLTTELKRTLTCKMLDARDALDPNTTQGHSVVFRASGV